MAQTQESEQLSLFSDAVTIPENIVDQVLRYGFSDKDNRLYIASICRSTRYFPEEVASLIANHFGRGSRAFDFDGIKVTVSYDEEGLYIAYGTNAFYTTNKKIISWLDVIKRIYELLAQGKYMSQDEIDRINGYEYKTVTEKLYFLYRDAFREVPYEKKYLRVEGLGFPNAVEGIKKKLEDPERIIDNILSCIHFLPEEKQTIPFSQKVNAAIELLACIKVPKRDYAADTQYKFIEPSFFVSDDEIDILLQKQYVAGTRDSVCYFFQEERSNKEKADFLQRLYGVGGSGNGTYGEFHDSKGIRYQRQDTKTPYGVSLKWTQVAKRIDKLIQEKRY